MKVDVDVSDIEECKADDRGRINLGIGYANKAVTVAVLEIQGD